VRLFPASLAAISTLGIPLVGTYSSALILDEPVGWREFTALVLVISALATVTLLPALRRRA
jgi:drug/metabolite transporter (DMT)-like permease